MGYDPIRSGVFTVFTVYQYGDLLSVTAVLLLRMPVTIVSHGVLNFAQFTQPCVTSMHTIPFSSHLILNALSLPFV